jgi:hypothetical protein
MNKKTTFSKKSKKEVKEHTKVSRKKKVQKKTSKNKNENKNINKNIITINGTGGSSGSSGSSSVIPIPYSMSTPVAPAPAPINIFHEPPSYIPIKQEPIQVKQEIPVHQDTPVKSPIKSPFDKIESKVDTPTKVNIENDIKKRNRVFIEPKTTLVSVNPSDLSNSSFFSKKIEEKNDLSKLIPLHTSSPLQSTPIITETYDMDTNKSKWFDNPLKFYDTDTGSSISSLTNKSNKSTDKSNKSTDKSNKSIENNENPNRDIDEWIRRLEQNIEPVKPKRHRRTKQEMIVFRAEQQRIKDEKERIKKEKLAEFERKAKIFFDKYG